MELIMNLTTIGYNCFEPINNIINDIGDWNNKLEEKIFQRVQEPSLTDLTIGFITITAKNVLHTTFSIFTNSCAILTAGLSARINNKTECYKNPHEYNFLLSTYVIFLRAVTKDHELIWGKNDPSQFRLGDSSFYENTKELLKSRDFGKRELLTRARFLGEGLYVIAKQIVLAVAGVIAGVGSIFLALITRKGIGSLNSFAITALVSSNSIHTALLTLRLAINPHALYPTIVPPASDLEDFDSVDIKTNLFLRNGE
jgi:hypothetical protein